MGKKLAEGHADLVLDLTVNGLESAVNDLGNLESLINKFQGKNQILFKVDADKVSIEKVKKMLSTLTPEQRKGISLFTEDDVKNAKKNINEVKKEVGKIADSDTAKKLKKSYDDTLSKITGGESDINSLEKGMKKKASALVNSFNKELNDFYFNDDFKKNKQKFIGAFESLYDSLGEDFFRNNKFGLFNSFNEQIDELDFRGVYDMYDKAKKSLDKENKADSLYNPDIFKISDNEITKYKNKYNGVIDKSLQEVDRQIELIKNKKTELQKLKSELDSVQQQISNEANKTVAKENIATPTEKVETNKDDKADDIIEKKQAVTIDIVDEATSKIVLIEEKINSLNNYKIDIVADIDKGKFDNKFDKINEDLKKINNEDKFVDLTSYADKINTLNTSFGQVDLTVDKVSNSVALSLGTQISALDSVIKKVDELKSSLKEAGATNVVNLTESMTALMSALDGKTDDDINKAKKRNKKKEKEKQKLLKETEKQKEEEKIPDLTADETIKAYDKLDSLLEASKKFKYKEGSLKINPDRSGSFKTFIKNKENEYMEIDTAFKNFEEDVLNGTKNKLKKDVLSKNLKSVSKTDVSKVFSRDDLKNKFLDFSSRTKGFDIDKSTISFNKGMVSFIGYVKNANGEVERLKYNISDVYNLNKEMKVLNRNGSFSQSFVKSGKNLSNIGDINSKVDELINKIREYNAIEGREGSFKSGTELNRKRNSLQKAVKDTKKELEAMIESSGLTQSDTDNIRKKILSSTANNKGVFFANKNTLNGVETKFNALWNAFNGDGKLELLSGQFDNVDGRVVNVTTHVEVLLSKLRDLKNNLTTGNFANRDEFNSLIADFEKTRKELNKYTDDKFLRNNKKGDFLKNIKLDDFKNNLQKTVRDVLEQKGFKNIKLEKGLIDNGKALRAEYLDGENWVKAKINFQEYADALNNQNIVSRLQVLNEAPFKSNGEKWISGLKEKMSHLTQYVTGIDIVMKVWNEVQQGFSFVKDLNSLMTTIYQTTDITKNSLDELSQSSINQARSLGVSTDQVAGAIEVYAAYGETVDSLLSKAEPTTMLAKASGGDVKVASDQIQGVVQQYTELEGHEDKIVNTFEKISANIKQDFGVGIQNIAEGVQVAGSVAKNAGLDFEEFAAIVAKTSETTRLEGSQIGNAMKTIMARVSRSKNADENVTAEDRGEASKALSNIGISVYDQNGAYQDFGKTLDQVSEKWDQLTDAERANVSEAMAGVRNVNIMDTIIEKWGEAKELASQVDLDPEFYKEVQEKGMDSLQSKMDTFKANTQDFWYNILNVDAINTGISAINTLGASMNNIIHLLKQVPGVGNAVSTTFIGLSAVIGSGFVDNIAKARSQMKIDGKATGIFNVLREGYSTTLNQVKSLGLDQAKSGFNTWGEAFKNAIIQSKSLPTKEVINDLGQVQMKLSGVASSAATFGKTIWGSMTTLSKGVVSVTAIFAALELAGKAFDSFTTSAKESNNAIEKIRIDRKKQTDTFKEDKGNIDKIKNEWSELAKGVDTKTNENVSLSSSEYERFLELNKQIAGVLPNTVSGLDMQGNAILNLSGSVSQLNEELSSLQENQAIKRYWDSIKDIEHESKRMSGNDSFWNKLKTQVQGGTSEDTEGAKETIKMLESLKEYANVSLLKKHIYGDNDSAIKGLNWSQQDYLEEALGINQDLQQNDWNTILNTGRLQSAIEDQKAILNNASIDVKQAMQDFLISITGKNGGFNDLDKNSMNLINDLITNMDSEFAVKLGQSRVAITNEIRKYASLMSKDDSFKNAVNDIFNMDDSFTLSKQVETYDESVEKIAKSLGKSTKEVENEFDFGKIKKVAKTYNKITDSLDKQKTLIEKTDFDKFIDENDIKTEEELNVLKNLMNKYDDWADVVKNWKAIDFDLEASQESLNELRANLEAVKTSVEDIGNAWKDSIDADGMTQESISKITSVFSTLEDAFDYDKLFESTAMGIRMNDREFEKLNDKYRTSEASKYSKKIEDLTREYQRQCEIINENSNALKNNENAIKARDGIKKQIREAQELQSMYEGLTNKFNQWQEATSGGEQGDNYDTIASSGIKGVKERYKKGEVGTREFKKFVEMSSPEKTDWSNANTEEYVNAYEQSIAKMDRWFTEEPGRGLNNFLTDLQNVNKELAHIDSEGNWQINADIEEMAEGLGISESLATVLVDKLKDMGFDIDFTEETDALKDMRKEAQSAFDSLDADTKNNYKINMDADSIDEASDQIKKLDKAITEAGDNDELKDQLKKIKKYMQQLKGEKIELEFDSHTEEGVSKLNDDLEKLKKVSKKVSKLNINWDSEEPGYYAEKIGKVNEALEDIDRNSDNTIDMNADGAKEALHILQELQRREREISEEDYLVSLNVDVSELSDSKREVIDTFNEIQSLVVQLQDSYKLKGMGFDIDTSSAESKLNDVIKKFNELSPDTAKSLGITATVSGEEKVSALAEKVTSLKSNEYLVKLGVNDSAIKEYKAGTKESIVKYTPDFSGVSNAVPPTLKGYIEYIALMPNSPLPASSGNSKGKGNKKGGGSLNGNAHATGTWGAKENAKSLVGELGRELIVRGNKWFTVGDNGAEFVDIKKDDIIFNHLQTDEIFSKGFVTSNSGRGKMANAKGNAYINGTAYSKGSYSGGGKFWGGASTQQVYAPIIKNNAPAMQQQAKEAAKDFKETVDWIEILIDRLERKINELDTIAGSAYQTFERRNEALIEQFSKVTEEIDLQRKAYDAYIQRANAVPLSEDYKNKIRDGRLQIEDITDENLKKQIDDFQEWYEKALDCKDAITDLNESLGEIVEANFDNVVTKFEKLVDKISHETDMLEGQLDIIENSGKFAGDAYFEELMKSQQKSMDKLQEQYIAMQDARNDAIWSGAIKEGSEADLEMQSQIDEIAKSWQDCKNSMLEYKNEMWEMQDSAFEWAQERISDLSTESDFINGLLSVNENDLFNKDTGRLNDKGMTSGSLHALNYDVYMAQADEYSKKINEINEELVKDPNNTILLERKQNYIDAQRESIEAANDEKQAIQDLISDSYDKMLDVLQELIDKKKEALEAEKELYSYEKDVSEKTKNIADLQKQLLSIQNDDSEEAKAKRQELQSSLDDAKADLEETEYDKYISDQEQLLDKMYDEYEKVLNERLDKIDELLQQMIDYGNNNSEVVKDTITQATTNVGYKMTEGMANIWNNTESGVGKILSTYNDNFLNTLTTTNNYIKGIFQVLKETTKSKVEVEKPKDTTRPKPTPPKPAPSKPAPKPQPPKKQVHVGGMINAGNAPIYSNNLGQGQGVQFFGYDPIYTVIQESNGYVLARWHKTNSGYSGWFRKSDVTALKTGGYTGNQEGMAMLHKKERVLNARQTEAFEGLVYNLLPALQKGLKANSNSIKQNSLNNNNVTIGNVKFELPNVTDPSSFMKELQKNKKFGKVIEGIILDSMNGSNSIVAKNRIRIK